MSKLEKFLYPFKKDENRTQNLAENKRDNVRLSLMMDLIERKMSISFGDLKNEEYLEPLTSFRGLELEGDKDRLLNSYDEGKRQYEKFIQERVITRTKGFYAPIKKCSIPVFKLSTEMQKKKVKAPNAEKIELKLNSKLLNICQDRPLITAQTLPKYQLSDYHALVNQNELEIKPNIRGNKASAYKDFLVKLIPDCVTVQKPTGVDFVILELENIINKVNGSNKTVSDYVESIFFFGIKQHLQYCPNILLIFDDPGNSIKPNLKKTSAKRYQTLHEGLDIHEAFLMSDFEAVIKSPENKQKLKKVIMDHIQQSGHRFISPGETIYLTGNYLLKCLWYIGIML